MGVCVSFWGGAVAGWEEDGAAAGRRLRMETGLGLRK